ncbi:MAG: hypothetical protein NC336_06490 [Clostridium sp.]|nr:hypothetical protein [Clostridium sp.]
MGELFRKLARSAAKAAARKAVVTLHRHRIAAHAATAGDLQRGEVSVGDFLTIGGTLGIVATLSDDRRHGIMIPPRIYREMFAHDFKYDPYLGENACSGEFRTGAYSRSDGPANTSLLERYGDAARMAGKNGEGWYLPAIEELKQILSDSEFPDVLASLESYTDGIRLSGEDLTVWSSTDLENDEYYMALTAVRPPGGTVTEHPRGKIERYYVIPVKPF